MVDEQRQEHGETPEEETTEPEQAETAEPDTSGDSEDEFDRDRAMATIENLRKIERQAKKDQKELDRLKAEKAKQEEAEKTELERAQAAADEAQKRVDEANNRVKMAEAKAVAASLGIKPERVQYAVKLADLSDVDVSEDGEPDTEAIKAAVEQVTKDIPELVGSKSAKVGGTNPGKNDMEGLPKPYNEMTIEEQTELFQRDPNLWERARAAAGFGD